MPEMDEIDYTSHLLVSGWAGGWDHPWKLHKDDVADLAADLEEALARKKPAGFAAWPKDDPERP